MDLKQFMYVLLWPKRKLETLRWSLDLAIKGMTDPLGTRSGANVFET